MTPLLGTLDGLECVEDLALAFPHLGLGSEGLVIRGLELEGLGDQALDIVEGSLANQHSSFLDQGEAGGRALLGLTEEPLGLVGVAAAVQDDAGRQCLGDRAALVQLQRGLDGLIGLLEERSALIL